MQRLFFVYIFCTDQLGDTNCRRRVRPFRAAAFSAPAERGHLNRAGGSPYPGGEFSAEPQRGDSPSADGGSVAAPAAGAKRKDNLRFSFLFELLPFPWRVWRRLPTCDRCEAGERQRIFSSAETHCVRSCIRVFAVSDTFLLHRSATLRRRDIPVSRNS